MYRIDNSTAIAVKPAKETAGSQGYWTKGDPAQGIPATVMDQDWLNMVQDELKNVIEAGGLTPDKADDSQLSQAIQLIASSGSSSSEEIYQPAHGFSKFDAVLHNGTIFAGAQADTPTNSSVVGIVGEVTDVDNFTLYYGGILEWDDPLNPDFTVGNDMFLATTTVKAIVDVEPTYNVGEVRQYIGEALPSGLLVNIDIGEEIDTKDSVKDASETEKGIAKIATQAIAEGKTNDTDIMTALKTQQQILASFDQSITSNGYTKLPNGIIIQWGQDELSEGSKIINYPTTFPNQWFIGILADGGSVNTTFNNFSFQFLSTSQFTAHMRGSGTSIVYWIAIGY